ncbi:DUF1203 domain-containing protein [Streptantibioticus cattleyicolor]|nr:conserved protein of unknown function [Streptantibioticus cattleyicolor NRRL 8057 = DSM 46488]
MTLIDDMDAAVAATAFEIRAIAPDVVAALRIRDDAGRAPRLVDAGPDGGSPLRCCLAVARPHEPLALVSYAPLRRWAAGTGAEPAAYDEVGPVFIHPEPCGGQLEFPQIRTGARRVLRAYDANGTILGGRMIEWPGRAGGEALLAESLADPRVAVVHVRAVEFGCFHFEVRRAA